MPIPTPARDEDHAVFLDRCMSDPTMVDEYPDGVQRFAVCQAQIGKNIAETAHPQDPSESVVKVRFRKSEPVTVRFVTGEYFSKRRAPVVCAIREKRLIYAVAMEPDVEDAHGEMTSKEEIEKAAHKYMASRVIGIQHEEEAPAELVESFIAPVALAYGNEPVAPGSWVVGIKIHDLALWERIKDGDFEGVSIGGFAQRVDDEHFEQTSDGRFQER